MKDYYEPNKTTNMRPIVCKYINICTSAGSFKCATCRHNRPIKRDYYEPMPYKPFIKPSNPYPFNVLFTIESKPPQQEKQTPYFSD